MERRIRRTLFVLAALAGTLTAGAPPAAAQTSGPETIRATLVVSGASGGRTLLTNNVVMVGALDAVGRLVEVPSLPSDGDDVLRDDIVLPGGVIHLVSENGAVDFRLDPRTCVFAVHADQTTHFAGGTGRFAAATGALAGTVAVNGITGRDDAGGCSSEVPVRHEVDRLATSGTLAF